jgi:hypothetical protein
LARLALANLDWFIETLATIIFMHLLLLEFEEEQEKKSNAMINSKQQNIDIGPFSSKPPNLF